MCCLILRDYYAMISDMLFIMVCKKNVTKSWHCRRNSDVLCDVVQLKECCYYLNLISIYLSVAAVHAFFETRLQRTCNNINAPSF
jgi:hypothetical protein